MITKENLSAWGETKDWPSHATIWESFACITLTSSSHTYLPMSTSRVCRFLPEIHILRELQAPTPCPNSLQVCNTVCPCADDRRTCWSCKELSNCRCCQLAFVRRELLPSQSRCLFQIKPFCLIPTQCAHRIRICRQKDVSRERLLECVHRLLACIQRGSHGR